MPVEKSVSGDLKARAKAARAEFARAPTIEDVIGPDGLADGVPYHFALLAGVARLRAAREAAGLTREELAAAAGLSPDTVADLETGTLANPSWQTLARYAVAVGCDLALSVERRPTGNGPYRHAE